MCVTHTLKALFFILEIFSIGLALVHNDAWTEKGNIHELLKTMIIPSKKKSILNGILRNKIHYITF